jgi:Fuc2NAc and GlcNAc transferase
VGISALAVVSPSDRQVGIALVAGGVVVAAVGWLDDRWGLPVVVRGGAHLVAAAWAVWWLRHTAGPANALGSAVSVLAIAWLINLYNFMDGVDGLAGVEALTVGGLGAVMLTAGGHVGLASAAALIAGGAFGFLCWNWQPARVFMGDVGSGLLGYLFGVLALATNDAGIMPAIVWAILLGVFLFDATATLVRRMLKRERWYRPHRLHAYQRLVQAGWTHRQVTWAVAALNGVLGGLAVWQVSDRQSWAPVAVAGGILALCYWMVERKRPQLSPDLPGVPG